MYLQRVNEISPNIRYCAYNIGDESAINDLMEMRLKSGQEDGLTNRLDVRLPPLSVSLSLSHVSVLSLIPCVSHSLSLPSSSPYSSIFPCLSISRPPQFFHTRSTLYVILSILISRLCGSLSSPSIVMLYHLDKLSPSVMILCHLDESSPSVAILCHLEKLSPSVMILCHLDESSPSVAILCHLDKLSPSVMILCHLDESSPSVAILCHLDKLSPSVMILCHLDESSPSVAIVCHLDKLSPSVIILCHLDESSPSVAIVCHLDKLSPSVMILCHLDESSPSVATVCHLDKLSPSVMILCHLDESSPSVAILCHLDKLSPSVMILCHLDKSSSSITTSSLQVFLLLHVSSFQCLFNPPVCLLQLYFTFLISSCSLLPVPPIPVCVPVYVPVYYMTTFPVLLMSYTPLPFSSRRVPNVCLLVP